MATRWDHFVEHYVNEPFYWFQPKGFTIPTGPLDLLARDRRKRRVVIELKRGRAADRTVGQLLRYMAFIVTERGGGKQSRVRGFAVARDPDERLIRAAQGAGVPIEVFEFAVQGRARRLHPGPRP